jgi:hypothetical protein
MSNNLLTCALFANLVVGSSFGDGQACLPFQTHQIFFEHQTLVAMAST